VPAIKYGALDRIRLAHEDLLPLFPALQGRRYVPGEGDNPQAFIIGEAPGAQEDIAGRPFVGAAGNVLRQLMDIAGLWATDSRCDPSKPANCWLTNVLKFRPPGNRNPTDVEIKAFRPLLMDEWEAVGAPSLIIPVGSVALRAVTGKPMSILRTAGKHHSYLSAKTGKQLHIWPMVHPAFGLRTPDVQPMLEADWGNLGRWRAAHS
jgi:DNA polymerase